MFLVVWEQTVSSDTDILALRVLSTDGRGHYLDNIFVERLVKYEDIYLKEYATVPALAAGLNDYFYLYNYERPHQN